MIELFKMATDGLPFAARTVEFEYAGSAANVLEVSSTGVATLLYESDGAYQEVVGGEEADPFRVIAVNGFTK